MSKRRSIRKVFHGEPTETETSAKKKKTKTKTKKDSSSHTSVFSQTDAERSRSEIIAEELSMSSLKEPNQSDNVEHLIAMIKALITTNQEIWERCKHSKCDEDYVYARNSYYFARIGYSEVQVEGSVQFSTIAQQQTYSSELPPKIPTPLSNIITVPAIEKGNIVPNYERYLKTALLLHQDILPFFLAHLKEHLEEIQVYLGKIDAWLQKGHDSLELINSLFNTTLEMPSIEQWNNRCIVLEKHPLSFSHAEKFHLDKEKDVKSLTKLLQYTRSRK